MLEFVTAVGIESWHVLVDAAPYVLFGFFVAGVLKAYVPDSFMANHLGKSSIGSVFKASVLGVPLPLCSCGVLPTALGLRRQGASKGATTAFMISTPETGVDSMAVTYALIDPIMTIVRPFAATVTAVVAGVLVNSFSQEDDSVQSDDGNLLHSPCASGGSCGCGHGGCEATPRSFLGKFRSGMDYAFGEMISDIGRWLLVGVVVAGVISVAVPVDFLDSYIGSGFLSYIVMLVVALPLYVCATASTPIAASLLLKGLSPGAALVFLLAGPATNGATITVMLKTLGRRAAGLYVFSIVVCSLVLAWLVDELYLALGLDVRAVVGEVSELLPHWIGVLSAIVLLSLVLWQYVARQIAPEH